MGASNGKTLPFSAEVLTRLRLRRVRAELPCFVLPIYYTMGNAACQSQIAKKNCTKTNVKKLVVCRLTKVHNIVYRDEGSKSGRYPPERLQNGLFHQK
jgi:hypothetical protein